MGMIWRRTPKCYFFEVGIPAGLTKEEVKVEVDDECVLQISVERKKEETPAGLVKEEVKMPVEDGRVLQISGERKKEETTAGEKGERVERDDGILCRFGLPEDVILEALKANIEIGFLKVTAPRVPRPASRARTIEVTET